MKEYIINILELIIMTDENLGRDTLPAPSYNYRKWDLWIRKKLRITCFDADKLQ